MSVLLLAGSVRVKAEENDYRLFDAVNKEVLLQTNDYSKASAAYKEALNEIAEPVLFQNETVIAMAYGTVTFAANEFSYYSLSRSAITQADGRYFNDALFLKKERGKVYFLLNGDYGMIDEDAVSLVPFSMRNNRVSCYEVLNGQLHHLIMEQNEWDYYSYDLLLDEVADWMTDGCYFSYDGHYFYDDFRIMSDDLREGSYVNSVNCDSPYYNYYLYMSYLSPSAYSAKELGYYLEDILRYQERISRFVDNNGDDVGDILNASQLYNSQEAFLKAEEQYGVNSVLLLAQAIEESAYGKSLSAYMQNNLFAYMALDSQMERENGAYRNIEDGILSYARYYVAGRYANFRLASYCGLYLGDKSSGLTSGYYTDPYHGEKIAAKAYLLDQALGLREKNSQWLVASKQEVPVYNSYNDELLYKSKLGLNIFRAIGEDEENYLLIDDSYIKKDQVFTLSTNKENALKEYPKTATEKAVKRLEASGYVNYDGYSFDLSNLDVWADGHKLKLSSDLFYIFDREQSILTLSYGGTYIEVAVKEVPFVEAADFATIRTDDESQGLCHLKGVDGLSVSGVYKYLCKEGIDTWHVSFIKSNSWRLNSLEYLDKAYGLKIEESYKLSFARNLKKVEPSGPIIVQFAYAGADNDNYSVYYRDVDGSFIKCPTQRSAGYIRFIAEKSGSYFLFSLDTFNDYSKLEDVDEHLTLAQSAPDTTNLIIEGLALMLTIIACVAEIFIYLIIKKKKGYLEQEALRYLRY